MARPRRDTIFTSAQLTLIRKGLQMNMTEAAEVLCRVKQRSYYQYEQDAYTPDEDVQERILSALKLRSKRFDEMSKLGGKDFEFMTLEDWLVKHNPTITTLMDCKLDWYIDMSVKSELVMKNSLNGII